MTYETLDLRREGAVLWCTLDRPDALNALSAKLVDEYRDLLATLAHDRETRIVVLRGAGRAFCAGLDLKDGGFAGDGGVSDSLRGQRHISEIAIRCAGCRRCSSPACTARPAAAASCWRSPRTSASPASRRA